MNVLTFTNRLTAQFFARITILSLLLIAFSAAFFIAEAATGSQSVQIDVEVMPHPSGGNADAEYVSFTNTHQNVYADLSDYSVFDLNGELSTLAVVPAGGTFTACADATAAELQHPSISCDTEYTGMFNNSGTESIIVKNSSGDELLNEELNPIALGSTNDFDFEFAFDPTIDFITPNNGDVFPNPGTANFSVKVENFYNGLSPYFEIIEDGGTTAVAYPTLDDSATTGLYEGPVNLSSLTPGDYVFKVLIKNNQTGNFEVTYEEAVPFIIDTQSNGDGILDNLPDFDLPDDFFIPGLGDGGNSGDDEGTQNDDKKVTVCQAMDNGEYTPYEMTTESILNPNGSDHELNQNDIIPPFAYGEGAYEGQNWDEGQVIWGNECTSDSTDTDVTYGCMDEEAINYNEDATQEGDVVCEYPELEIPERCSMVEEFIVPADSATGADSTSSLDDGRDYFAVVAGTYIFGDPKNGEDRVADAEYSLDAGDTTWKKEFSNARPNVLDLFINGTNPDFGTFRSDHTYGTLFVGTGAPANFAIADDPYSDNSGSLDVTLYECAKELYTIDGYKYEVNISDGIPTNSEYLYESPIKENWEIELYNGEGELVATTTTDENGYYYFEVKSGDYEVREVVPTDWTQIGVQPNTDEYEFTNGEPYTCEFTFDYDGAYGGEYDSDYRCDFYNARTNDNEEAEEENEEEETDDTNRPSTRSGVSTGTRIDRRAAPEPQVAGAADSVEFCPLLTEYMQMGTNNDTLEVQKLQIFLNVFKDMYGGTENPVTGDFGATTDANVKAFQQHFQEDILDPWYNQGIVPHNRPTGFVYKTTLWKINSIVCPEYTDMPSFVGEDLNTNVAIN